MDIPHFIHSSVDGHLGCFYLLAVVNNVAMNIGIQIPESQVSESILLGIYLGEKLLEHMVILCLTF